VRSPCKGRHCDTTRNGGNPLHHASNPSEHAITMIAPSPARARAFGQAGLASEADITIRVPGPEPSWHVFSLKREACLQEAEALAGRSQDLSAIPS